MKTKLILLFVLSFFAVMASAQTWNEVGNGGFSSGEVYSLKMALDGDIPYVAYIDDTYDRKITVMKFNGSIWEPVGVPGFGEPAVDLDFVIENGYIYVAYASQENKISVMTLLGGTWQYVGTPGFAQSGSISLSASAGVPYVAFSDDDASGKVTVKKYGSGWQTVGTPGFTTDTYVGVIDIKVADGIYIAYRNDDLKTTVMSFNSNNDTWSVVGEPGFTGTLSGEKYLTIYQNSPCVIAWNNNAQATVYSFSGSTWQILGNEGISVGQAEYSSITTAPDGSLYIAYNDMGNANKVYVKKYVNGVWEGVGNDAVSKLSGEEITISVNQNGKPYIAYKDWWYMRRATVMAYGKANGINDHLSIENVHIFPNPAGDNIRIRNMGNITIENMKIYDREGRLVFEKPLPLKKGDEKTINLSVLIPGIYHLTMTNGNETINKVLIKN